MGYLAFAGREVVGDLGSVNAAVGAGPPGQDRPSAVAPPAHPARPVCTARTRDLQFGCLTRSEGGAVWIASLTEGMDGTQNVELALRAARAARLFSCAPPRTNRDGGRWAGVPAAGSEFGTGFAHYR